MVSAKGESKLDRLRDRKPVSVAAQQQVEKAGESFSGGIGSPRPLQMNTESNGDPTAGLSAEKQCGRVCISEGSP